MGNCSIAMSSIPFRPVDILVHGDRVAGELGKPLQDALESLCLQFEQSKPELIERWNHTQPR